MPDFAPTAHLFGLNEITNCTPLRGKDLLSLDQEIAYLAAVRKLQVPASIGFPLDSAFMSDGYGKYQMAVRIPPCTDWVTIACLLQMTGGTSGQYWRSRLSVDAGATWTAWSKVPCDQDQQATSILEAGWSSTIPTAIRNPLVVDEPHSHPVVWSPSEYTGIIEFEASTKIDIHTVAVIPEITDLSKLDR